MLVVGRYQGDFRDADCSAGKEVELVERRGKGRLICSSGELYITRLATGRSPGSSNEKCRSPDSWGPSERSEEIDQCFFLSISTLACACGVCAPSFMSNKVHGTTYLSLTEGRVPYGHFSGLRMGLG